MQLTTLITMSLAFTASALSVQPEGIKNFQNVTTTHIGMQHVQNGDTAVHNTNLKMSQAKITWRLRAVAAPTGRATTNAGTSARKRRVRGGATP
ncbi:hypothetical protein E8E12_003325 [Didymella heteroderae]|uniref:Uncharacterized protein n=1 Tax=Didymella heteroderae TaxID=1769908 RepID=A0A9P4WHC6_9PLEO|nr:hypothetical protein E8E12_003325 [Didymella heteroderae]